MRIVKDKNNKCKCNHDLVMFNTYHNIYECKYCHLYWIPTKETKTRVTWSPAFLKFSDNDDRIINIWCEDLAIQREKYLRSRKFKKEMIKEMKRAKKMYPTNKYENQIKI